MERQSPPPKEEPIERRVLLVLEKIAEALAKITATLESISEILRQRQSL